MLGVSDWERAPSPKKLRKTFGILKITTKISWILPAPKKFVKIKSLKYPNTRETSVNKEKLADDFQKFDIFNYFSSIQSLKKLNSHNILDQFFQQDHPQIHVLNAPRT